MDRTRVQDELDSLCSYTWSLVDPSTGRPYDIMHLRQALDESKVTLSAALTSMGTMQVQIGVLQANNAIVLTEMDCVHDLCASSPSWPSREGLTLTRALHRVTRVVESLGTEANTILEEYDKRDPILSITLGRFCRETSIRLDHL